MVLGFWRQNNRAPFRRIWRLQMEESMLPNPRASPPEITATADQKIVVLVVEDEPDIREIASSALSECGYRVVCAPNADVAIDLMRVISPDVLFSDIMMPGECDGFQLAKVAKKLHPLIKVIMTSGYDFMLRDASAKRFGAVLQKPYRAWQLIAEVEKAVSA